MKTFFALVTCCLVGLTTGFPSFFKSPCESQQHTCYALASCPTGTTSLSSGCFDNKICCTGTPECFPSPCGANGDCVFVGGANQCNCKAGYTGNTCDVDVCASMPCQSGGTCMRTTTGTRYTCGCAAGFTGVNCEIDLCASMPCQSGGTCMGTTTGTRYTCGCAAGYTGVNCEIDLCMSNPCLNNGNCSHAANSAGYSCSCEGNYFGNRCDQNLCLGNPCDTVDLAAACVYPDPANVQMSRCDCTVSAGFFGELCDQNVCDHNPCNGGNCTNIADTGYTCMCPFNRTGENCTEAVCPGTAAECSGRGTCVPMGSTPMCTCTEGFFGDNCESEAPPCGTPILPTARIFSGKDDVAEQNPWVVTIVQTSTNDVFCSGTIVDLDWIVYDAFCAAFCDGSCHVLLRDYNGTGVEEMRNIASVRYHPNANFNSLGALGGILSSNPEGLLPYNVVVAKLSAPIVPSVGVNRVCPPSDVYNTFRAPRICKVAAFGKQNAINETTYAKASVGVRQVLDAVLLDDAVSAFIRNRTQPVSTHSGFSTSGALLCSGDNGAAVVCQNATSREWTFEGTVSFFPDNTENLCARTFIYTDMNAAWPFIQETIQANAG